MVLGASIDKLLILMPFTLVLYIVYMGLAWMIKYSRHHQPTNVYWKVIAIVCAVVIYIVIYLYTTFVYLTISPSSYRSARDTWNTLHSLENIPSTLGRGLNGIFTTEQSYLLINLILIVSPYLVKGYQQHLFPIFIVFSIMIFTVTTEINSAGDADEMGTQVAIEAGKAVDEAESVSIDEYKEVLIEENKIDNFYKSTGSSWN